MREIKGRYWDEKENRFYYFTLEGELFFPKGLEIQLSTGLKDKNGKEIYEGDILRGEHLSGPVCFGEFSNEIECDDCSHADDFIGWHVKDKHQGYISEWLRALDSYANQCEVIGNIYENGELLK